MSNSTNFEEAITGAYLNRADIARFALRSIKVRLVDCDASEADLSDLNLSNWSFEKCVLRRARFTSSCLEGTRWISCRGPLADFAGADLTESEFRSCDFNNAIFRRCILSFVSFAGCKLTGADITETKSIDIGFEETLLNNAQISGISFRKKTLKKVDFSQSDIKNCDFRDAIFDDCSLRDAIMKGSRFEGSDLQNADIAGLRLMDAALFRGATISKAQAGQLLAELGLQVR